LTSGHEYQLKTKEGFCPSFAGILLQICATCENPTKEKQCEAANIAGERRPDMLAGGIAEEGHKRDSVKERVKEKAAKEQLETDSLPKNIVGVNVNFFIPAVFPEEKT
jgi:hypothetical protein